VEKVETVGNIELPNKIAVISDTHGLLRDEVIETAKECDAIFHLGDIGSKEVYDQLNQLGKLYAVKGNVDGEWAKDLPDDLFVELYEFSFYLVHDKSKISEERSKKADIIIYGHSHRYEMYEEGLKIYFNPGSCGTERFRLPITMAVFHINEMLKGIRMDRIDIPGSRDLQQESKMSAARFFMEELNMKKNIRRVVKGMKKNKSTAFMASKYHISEKLVKQICRLYVTHPGVDVDGIMDKLEVSALY